jgi:hypothetical protein
MLPLPTEDEVWWTAVVVRCSGVLSPVPEAAAEAATGNPRARAPVRAAPRRIVKADRIEGVTSRESHSFDRLELPDA